MSEVVKNAIVAAIVCVVSGIVYSTILNPGMPGTFTEGVGAGIVCFGIGYAVGSWRQENRQKWMLGGALATLAVITVFMMSKQGV